MTEEFRDTWSLLLGARLAWFPVPFVSLETEFGLMYQWWEVDTTLREYYSPDGDWSRRQNHSKGQGFQDFGPYSLTGDIQIIIWF